MILCGVIFHYIFLFFHTDPAVGDLSSPHTFLCISLIIFFVAAERIKFYATIFLWWMLKAMDKRGGERCRSFKNSHFVFHALIGPSIHNSCIDVIQMKNIQWRPYNTPYMKKHLSKSKVTDRHKPPFLLLVCLFQHFHPSIPYRMTTLLTQVDDSSPSYR